MFSNGHKTITKIIIETDENGNIFLNDQLVPTGISLNSNGFVSTPYPCLTCPNHPTNGGSGICHCILGSPKITC